MSVQEAKRTNPEPADAPVPWHALGVAEVLERLGTGPEGLREEQVREHRERYGENRLPAPPPRPAWRRWLAQFNNVLIHLLLVAAVAALVLGHRVDAAVIFAVVLINALIGFIQEGKAERAMEAIGRMLAPKARVCRDGRWTVEPAETLVPGDVVSLKAGDRVPADLRMIEAHGMQVDQAALTGESLPVDKSTSADAEDAPLADRASLVHASGMVTLGRGAAWWWPPARRPSWAASTTCSRASGP